MCQIWVRGSSWQLNIYHIPYEAVTRMIEPRVNNNLPNVENVSNILVSFTSSPKLPTNIVFLVEIPSSMSRRYRAFIRVLLPHWPHVCPPRHRAYHHPPTIKFHANPPLVVY